MIDERTSRGLRTAPRGPSIPTTWSSQQLRQRLWDVIGEELTKRWTRVIRKIQRIRRLRRFGGLILNVVTPYATLGWERYDENLRAQFIQANQQAASSSNRDRLCTSRSCAGRPAHPVAPSCAVSTVHSSIPTFSGAAAAQAFQQSQGARYQSWWPVRVLRAVDTVRDGIERVKFLCSFVVHVIYGVWVAVVYWLRHIRFSEAAGYAGSAAFVYQNWPATSASCPSGLCLPSPANATGTAAPTEAPGEPPANLPGQ
jgi:hypothetical protein